MSKDEITITHKSDSSSIVPYVFNSERIVSKTCKLCQCEFREEVEEWYDQQRRKNYSEIRDKLTSEKNLSISINAVKNHMLYHFKAAEKKSTLTEYTKDIQNWVSMQTNKVASLRTRIAILEREMMIIGAEGEELDLTERRKNAETISKLANILLIYDTKLKEYEQKLEPVKIIFNQLKVIVNEEMKTINDASTKQTLFNVMSRFKENVGDMIIDYGG